MDQSRLERTLEPFELKLKAQETFRRRLGVKEVDHPTYERYITGPIKRFHSQKNAFAVMKPDNPYGEEFRQLYQRRTGVDWFSKPLPQSELDPDARVEQSLAQAAQRLCAEYHPTPKPVTPPEGRVEVPDRARMSRLIKKVGMWLGADMVRITKIDPRWVYEDVNISHEFAIICVVPHYTPFNNTAPSHISGAAVWQTYSRLKYITTQLTDFICGLGYDAAYRETIGLESRNADGSPGHRRRSWGI